MIDRTFFARPYPHHFIIFYLQRDNAPAATERAHGVNCLYGRPSICLFFLHKSAGRTDSYTRSAKSALGILQRHIVQRCRLGDKAPCHVIDCSFNNEFLVCTDTFGTGNTLGKVSFYKRINFLDSAHLRDTLKFHQPHTHHRSQLTELAPVPLITYQTGVRVTGKHKLNNDAPAFRHTL